MFKLLKGGLIIATLILGFQTATYAQLDSDSAVVSLEVAKFAQVSGLDDFILSPISTDGDRLSIYNGFDMFNLESNSAVSVTLSGDQLSNGVGTISTTYALDDNGMSFDTAAGIHNNSHKVSAEATLGEISEQEAGAYSAQIVITVAAL